jgi:hypothetical protein
MMSGESISSDFKESIAMFTKNILVWFTFSLLTVHIMAYQPAIAWETGTHELMNIRAIRVQEIGEGQLSHRYPFQPASLFWELGFDMNGNGEGWNAFVTREMVERWIKEGGVSEDQSPRFLNHFHDPLLPWDRAGLRIVDIPLFPSSVVWAQLDRGMQYGGASSWHDAREYYYRALTDASPAARLQWFEKSFRALGQIMHLVEDAAVPDHVRNDILHGPKALLGIRDTFEQWTDEHLAAFGDLPLPGFSDLDLQRIFGEPGDPQAPLPISRIIDMNLIQRGERPEITGTTLAGIAEYSNSNFLSADTIFQIYEHPALESTEPMEGGNYLRKVKAGERIEYFVKSRSLDQEMTFTLDPKCYHDYARLLVPKAIASASLIPYYFFRPFGFSALISCSCDEDRGCFATGAGALYVYNPTTEPIRGGQLEIYTGAGQRRLVMTIPIGYLPPCIPQDDFPHCNPFLAVGVGTGSEFWGEDVIAVFRGTLGRERDAVLMGHQYVGCVN